MSLWINTLTIIARQYLGKVRTQLACRGFEGTKEAVFLSPCSLRQSIPHVKALLFHPYRLRYRLMRLLLSLRMRVLSVISQRFNDQHVFPWETSLYRPGFPRNRQNSLQHNVLFSISVKLRRRQR